MFGQSVESISLQFSDTTYVGDTSVTTLIYLSRTPLTPDHCTNFPQKYVFNNYKPASTSKLVKKKEFDDVFDNRQADEEATDNSRYQEQ